MRKRNKTVFSYTTNERLQRGALGAVASLFNLYFFSALLLLLFSYAEKIPFLLFFCFSPHRIQSSFLTFRHLSNPCTWWCELSTPIDFTQYLFSTMSTQSPRIRCIYPLPSFFVSFGGPTKSACMCVCVSVIWIGQNDYPTLYVKFGKCNILKQKHSFFCMRMMHFPDFVYKVRYLFWTIHLCVSSRTI